MRRRSILWRITLIAGAVALTAFLILRYELVAVTFKGLHAWSLRAAIQAKMLLKQLVIDVARFFVGRKAFMPVWKMCGMEWLCNYAAAKVRFLWVSVTMALGQVWRKQSRIVQAAVIAAAAAVFLFFGLGLWLLPLGVPFWAAMAARAKAAWADSWTRRKLRAVQPPIRRWLRQRRDWRTVGAYRATRLWVLRRDRKWSRKADAVVGSVEEFVANLTPGDDSQQTARQGG